MRRHLALLSLVLASAAGGAAHAQVAVPPLVSDLRCVVVNALLAGSGDDKTKASAGVAVFYYLGRIDSREPGLDLESRLRTEGARMTVADLQSEARRCGGEMAQRAQQIQAVGQHLQIRTPATPAL